MLFEIKNCKIREVTDATSGTSQSGKDWRKATVIIEQEDGSYTETYAIQAFDDKIDVVCMYVGEKVDIGTTASGLVLWLVRYTNLSSSVPVACESHAEWHLASFFQFS